MKRLFLVLGLAILTLSFGVFGSAAQGDSPTVKCLQGCQASYLACREQNKGNSAALSECTKTLSTCEKGCRASNR